MNAQRTLSGLTTLKADQLELPSSIRAIAIKGDYGVKGQTLQKDSNNRLKWGFVDDIEIPDGSITGEKLAPDININTTGDITATDITATNYFNQTNENAVNTFAGELILPKLETTNTDIEAIRVRNGGIIHIMENDGGSPDPAIMISLSGVNGNIYCNQIRSSQIGFPNGGSIEVYLNENGLTLTPDAKIDADGSVAELKNLLLYGGTGLSANQTIICLGGITTGTDSAGNLGSILMNTGGLSLLSGDLLLSSPTSTATFKGSIDVYGNSLLRGGADFVGDNSIDVIDSGSNLQMRIYPASGNIDNSNGKLTMSKSGSTPAPIDSSTYTDWAIDVSNTNGHMRVAGNIICDGKIYGAVEGAITEEEVDCQRLTIRTATPPISGITGIIMGTGSKITNDLVGTNQLTITADTGDILCNTFQSKGNTALGSDPNSIITFGSYGANLQQLEVLCSTINLGETAGNQAQNVLNYRGGVHTFTGQKVVIGDYIGFTLIDCALEGINNRVSNRYTNAFNYFNMNGALNTHTLSGTIQQYRILRSSSQRQQLIAHTKPFTNSSTIYTTISGFSFVNIFCVTTVAKITIEYLFRKTSGNPDLYCRIDDTLTGASAYPSQIGGPTLLVNTNFTGEIRKQYSFFITGLPQGFQKSFYPKFADTTTSTNKGYLMYGGSFGDTTMTIEFLQDFDGTITDPLAPSGDDY